MLFHMALSHVHGIQLSLKLTDSFPPNTFLPKRGVFTEHAHNNKSRSLHTGVEKSRSSDDPEPPHSFKLGNAGKGQHNWP